MRVNAWDVAALLKYSASRKAVRSYVAAGGRLRIGPEVRYTRWLTRALDDLGSQYGGGFHPLFSSQNQLDFFLGLRF